MIFGLGLCFFVIVVGIVCGIVQYCIDPTGKLTFEPEFDDCF